MHGHCTCLDVIHVWSCLFGFDTCMDMAQVYIKCDFTTHAELLSEHAQ